MGSRRNLSDRAQRLLDTDETTIDTFSAISSVAMSCHVAGMGFDQFSSAVWSSALGADYYTEKCLKTRGQFDKNIRDAWEHAERNFDYGYRERIVRQRLTRLAERVRSMPWPGRGGSSDRAVALALIETAYGLDMLTFDADSRKLSEVAGVSHQTVNRAVSRLETIRFLGRSRQRASKHAARYSLNHDFGRGLSKVGNPSRDSLHNVEPSPDGSTYTHSTTCGPVSALTDDRSSTGSRHTCGPVSALTEHPAFLPAALGQGAGRVFERVSKSAATTAEIVLSTGLANSTVRLQLAKLADAGLISKAGRRNATYATADDVDLDSIAEDFGVSDWRERTADRYRAEREGRDAELLLRKIAADTETAALVAAAYDDDRRRIEESNLQ